MAEQQSSWLTLDCFISVPQKSWASEWDSPPSQRWHSIPLCQCNWLLELLCPPRYANPAPPEAKRLAGICRGSSREPDVEIQWPVTEGCQKRHRLLLYIIFKFWRETAQYSSVTRARAPCVVEYLGARHWHFDEWSLWSWKCATPDRDFRERGLVMDCHFVPHRILHSSKHLLSGE